MDGHVERRVATGSRGVVCGAHLVGETDRGIEVHCVLLARNAASVPAKAFQAVLRVRVHTYKLHSLAPSTYIQPTETFGSNKKRRIAQSVWTYCASCLCKSTRQYARFSGSSTLLCVYVYVVGCARSSLVVVGDRVVVPAEVTFVVVTTGGDLVLDATDGELVVDTAGTALVVDRAFAVVGTGAEEVLAAALSTHAGELVSAAVSPRPQALSFHETAVI